MSERAAEANDATASADVTIPQELYDLIDCQNAPVPGSSHKPDGVFYYSETTGGGIPSVHMCVEAKIASNPGTIPSDNLGQILDYINAIWTEQPTRVIVPILYIHGKALTLFVFTRGPWYRVELGNICYPSITPSLSATHAAHKCLQRLWFILTLPADRFGHFCNIDKGTENIQFSRVYGGISKVANASLTSSIDSDVLSLRKRIPRPVNPRSRVAYLFDTTYNSKRAVLKLSWTPIKRLPESAVYDILHKANVEGVPVVYDSGLLKTDAFGYRLEYIILEHCGQSIERYVSECRERNTPDSEIGRHVELYIRQVSTCLVQARAYGILHRDISDGNIAVRDGQAKVIDWGYSKIIETDPAAGTRGIDPAIVDEVSKQWGFDKDAVLKNETTWDPLTGTVMFMSIPVLFGRLKRGLFDDIESLFYVVIRAFSDSKECMGFKFHDSKTFAVTRVGFLGCAEDYLEFFGISKDLGELKQTIDAMSKYLFYAGDRYIGHKLISNAEYERVPDLSLAVRFMDEEAVGMLRRFLPDDPVEEARSSTKRMRISNTPGADEAAGALPVPAKRPRGRPPKRGRGRGKV
ncbi:hypothetical protein EV175_000418 [Coemansia sp. RSA 1933]|nr:hypothetical protein EV175_000418 [Coemansia sp. RSA 1933]